MDRGRCFQSGTDDSGSYSRVSASPESIFIYVLDCEEYLERSQVSNSTRTCVDRDEQARSPFTRSRFSGQRQGNVGMHLHIATCNGAACARTMHISVLP